MKFRYQVRAKRDPDWNINFSNFLMEIKNAGFAGEEDGTIECKPEDVAQVSAIAVKHHLDMNFIKTKNPQQDNEKKCKDEM